MNDTEKISQLKEQFRAALEMLEFSYAKLSNMPNDSDHSLAIQAAAMVAEISFDTFLRSSVNCREIAVGTLDIAEIGFPEFSKSYKLDPT